MASLRNLGASGDKPKNYFGVLKFVLKLVGINIDGNDGAAYRIYSILVVLFVNISYPILDFLEIFKHDFNVFVEEMCMYMFSFTLASVKTFVFILQRNKIAKMLRKLHQEPFTPNPNRGGEEEEKLIKECVWLTTAQALTYWSFAILVIIVAGSIPIIKRLRSNDYHDWVFSYGPFTVLNVTYSPNYEISWTYQFISASCLAAQFTSVDLITAAILAHISYQFKILQITMRRLVPISYEKMLRETGPTDLLPEENLSVEIDGSVIPWKYLKHSLVDATNYYLAIINIAEEMESLFSSLLLIVFLSTLGIICFLLYQTSLLSLGDPKLWSCLGEVVCACLQVAVVCYWGEQVMFQSEEVGRAAYEGNFVGTDLKFQKSLILIIRQSQNPTRITAGKFSAISLATFVWIIQTSYSAFTVFKNTQD